MPRKRNATTNSITTSKPRRSTRHGAAETNAIPDVYTDMLREAYNNNPDDFTSDPRPAKRRRVGRTSTPEPTPPPPQEPALSSLPISPAEESDTPAETLPRQQQVIFNNDYDDSDDSEIEFEDVEINRGAIEAEASEPVPSNFQPLQIDLLPKIVSTSRKAIIRRKPVTKAEREFRLDVHKWHLLSLLVHLAMRNKWCDDETVQRTLKPLVPRKTISQLHPDDSYSQVKRKVSFDQAIQAICETWRAQWKVTAPGMRRAYWRESLDITKEIEDAEDPVDFEDFRHAAISCSGSRDLGAQLLCALLRSVAVETRLVSSLQALPFSRVAKGETPIKSTPAYIHAGAQDFGTTSQSRPAITKKKQKKFIESSYPIFWVEVYSPAITQWVPLDPVVRNTINKPRTGFEPPASDNLNAMSYVVAFEDDGAAKDVTRRYVSAYNAKTLKTRVESTKNGEEWWSKTMRFFERTLPEARDDVEDAALDRKMAGEGMPKNVQDFKNHPIYVLERHLRANEVIEPKREAGKFTVGIGKNAKVESVYRRQDVYLCRSADAWYRKGREVRAGEQPLKRVIARNKRTDSAQIDGDADNNENEDEGVALYAEYQTNIYIPPPIIDGRVPRNGFGNLDVYVRSMIPAGGVHIRHPLAVQAAKTLKIDFAEAVTGFSFKGRQGTAIVDGIVIATHCTASVVAVTTELEDELNEQVTQQRSAIVLSAWKKMLAVLQVRQRVQDEYGGRDNDVTKHEQEDDDDDPIYVDKADGGGFFPDTVEATTESRAEEAASLNVLKDRQPLVLPRAVVRIPVQIVRSLHKLEEPQSSRKNGQVGNTARPFNGEQSGPLSHDHARSNEDVAGGFVVEDEVDDAAHHGGGFVLEEEEQAGGFVVDHVDVNGQLGYSMPAEEGGGGFVLKEESVIESPSKPPSSENLPLDQQQPQPFMEDTGIDDQGTGKTISIKISLATDSNQANHEQGRDEDTKSYVSELSHDPEEDQMEPEWLSWL